MAESSIILILGAATSRFYVISLQHFATNFRLAKSGEAF
jgi:hypothetical protein